MLLAGCVAADAGAAGNAVRLSSDLPAASVSQVPSFFPTSLPSLAFERTTLTAGAVQGRDLVSGEWLRVSWKGETPADKPTDKSSSSHQTTLPARSPSALPSVSPSVSRPPLLATVVVFLSATCPCSQSHEPALAQLAATYGPQGVQFVGFHTQLKLTREAAAAHFKLSKIRFPVFQDVDNEAADTWGALKTPHVFVLAPSDGSEVLYQGGVDNSQIQDHATVHFLKEALDAVVRGQKPDRSITRTLGCLIAR